MKYYLQLLEKLKKGEIAPVNLFYGPEAYLREQAIKRYRDALVAPGMAEFNYSLMDGAEVSEQDVVNAASIPPVFGGKRLVVVRRARFFKPSAAKEKQNQSSILINYINRPVRETCLVLETGDPVDRRRKIFKELARCGEVVEFSRLNSNDLAKWIFRLAERAGKNISRPGVELLLNRCGRNMYEIYNEMNKLIDFTGQKQSIGEEDVRLVVTDRGEENIFRVVDALGNKRYAEALQIIRHLLRRRESPQAILAMLARQVRLIIQANELSAAGYSFTEITSTMGLPPFVCKKVLSQGKNFNRHELLRLLRGMLLVDEQVKTGRQDFYPALEMLLADFCVAQ